MHVCFKVITCVDAWLCVFQNLAQLVWVDRGDAVCVCIILMVGLVEIDLCEEGSTGSLCRTTLLGLRQWQYLVCSLEVVDDLLPGLVVSVLSIGEVEVVVLCQIRLVHERNVLEQALKLEVSVSPEEQHLCGTLLNDVVALVCLCQHIQ